MLPRVLLRGMLDPLILKAISLKRLHGHGVLFHIQQVSGQDLRIRERTLHRALCRLEQQGLIDSEWGESENRRHAKYYRLTDAGRHRLKDETASWERSAAAMAAALRATPRRPARSGDDGRQAELMRGLGTGEREDGSMH